MFFRRHIIRLSARLLEQPFCQTYASQATCLRSFDAAPPAAAFHKNFIRSVSSTLGRPPSRFERKEEGVVCRVNARSISSSTSASHARGASTDDGGIDEAYENAFGGLIEAAYELLARGSPERAEAVLREGAEHAEKLMGKGSVGVAPLYDQLSLIQFMHDRPEEARDSALRAWTSVRDFAAAEGSADARGAAATAAVRAAAALVACHMPKEAAEVLGPAMTELEAVVEHLQTVADSDEAESNGDGEGPEQFIEKFATAQAEGRFYSALLSMALAEEPSVAQVEASTAELEQALADMAAYLGHRHPLAACAMREHNKMTEAAVEAEMGDIAEAMYMQEIRMFQQFDPEGEEAAALCYQLGTLQYCQGRPEAAIRTLQRAVRLLEREFEGAEDHLVTVRHRMGMAMAVTGEHVRARKLLALVAPQLTSKLGEGNPMSHEMALIEALMGIKEGAEDGAAAEALLAKMEGALNELQVYGPEHMLVQTATKYFEEAKELVLAGKGDDAAAAEPAAKKKE